MGVAEQLGLGSRLDSELLVEASGRWMRWTRETPVLAQVDDLALLPDWLRKSPPAAADDVLLSLVRLGSPEGSDEVAASGAVAWALLPGACTLARRLRPLSADIDVLIAAQLWLEVRSFEWWRLRRVAANVLARTRNQVLRECGVLSQVRKVDRTWASTVLCDPMSVGWSHHVEVGTSASSDSAAELQVILADAEALGLLHPLDRPIIERLLAHADTLGGTRAGRGQGGLLADQLVATVADEMGVSPATVRRRTRRLVGRLAEASRSRLVAA